ncbi:conserved hypothetical protein [Streptomyces pristinaespiralis ATCC 25486]|uniref:Uncharacterized protein n=1 Tax=Streptomyces pristinaespiralis (strain ATCC 25486 / DSM 40338 / CBS 914.69 / JCM 4507 / KCC S-0507 / NBRC 13074 / NRRL 2958 / 5647) TaxID=457429 RepID=B5H8B9_STRE2|nr:conserved hypothetical protein [Streptomyces pristinaespiralis ATCC 25486]
MKGRQPRSDSTVRLLGGGPVMSQSPAVLEVPAPLADAGTDPTMDAVQVKKFARFISHRVPDTCR